MFLLKRVTNFQKHKYFYKLEDEIFVITSSTVERFDKNLSLLDIIDFRDKILSTICDGNIYILTLTHFIDLKSNIKIYLEHKYKKMHKYKDLILFVSTNKLAFFEYKNNILKLKWEYVKKNEDVFVKDNLIFILENNYIYCYEYFNKILLRKAHNLSIECYNKNKDKLGINKLIIGQKSIVLCQEDKMIILEECERFFDFKNFTVFKHNDKTSCYDNHLKQYYTNEEMLIKASNYKFEIFNLLLSLDYYDKELDLFIYNNQIVKEPKINLYKIGKRPGLVNLRNIKYNFTYDSTSNIDPITDNCYSADTFFIQLRNLQYGFQTSKYIILISDIKIYRYVIDDKKVYFLDYKIFENLLFVNYSFLYYSANNNYFIYEFDTQTTFKYYNTRIKDILKNKDKLSIVTNSMIKIYKINYTKYDKIQMNVNNDTDQLCVENTLNNFLDKEVQLNLINSEYKLCKGELCINLGKNVVYFNVDKYFIYVGTTEDVKIYKINNINKPFIKLNYGLNNKLINPEINYDNVPLVVCVHENMIFINTKSGLAIYKNNTLYRKDPISRNISSFYISNNKIYSNDSSKFLIVQDFNFAILGIIFIGENIKTYFEENNKITLKTDINNIIEIKETTTVKDADYFNNYPRINFVVNVKRKT